MSIQELANLFHVSESSAYNIVKRHHLPTLRVLNTIRIPRAAVEALKKQHTSHGRQK